MTRLNVEQSVTWTQLAPGYYYNYYNYFYSNNYY